MWFVYAKLRSIPPMAGPLPRILITAGATREYLDDIRYLSNPSTGRLGREIASAALEKGWDVCLVHGQSDAQIPKGVESQPVTSAADMFDAVEARYHKYDVFISTAAVADFTPSKRIEGKIRKENKSELELKLVRTKDILAWACDKKKPEQINIGFALDPNNDVAVGREKMNRKRCDLLIQNAPSNFGEGGGQVHIMCEAGLHYSGELDKAELASRIVDLIEQQLDGKTPSVSKPW